MMRWAGRLRFPKFQYIFFTIYICPCSDFFSVSLVDEPAVFT